MAAPRCRRQQRQVAPGHIRHEIWPSPARAQHRVMHQAHRPARSAAAAPSRRAPRGEPAQSTRPAWPAAIVRAGISPVAAGQTRRPGRAGRRPTNGGQSTRRPPPQAAFASVNLMGSRANSPPTRCCHRSTCRDITGPDHQGAPTPASAKEAGDPLPGYRRTSPSGSAQKKVACTPTHGAPAAPDQPVHRLRVDDKVPGQIRAARRRMP